MAEYFAKQKEILKNALELEEGQEVDLFVKSPGRFNMIGEHTDYNGGFVMPGALDRHIYFAFKKYSKGQKDYKLSIKPLSMGNEWFTIKSPSKEGDLVQKYASGVLDYLINNSEKSDFSENVCVKIACCSDLPIGAGVSSSAALCVGIAFGLNHLYNLGLERMNLAHCARFSENTFVGLQCGLMDQFIIAHGKAGCVFKFDCRSLEFTEVNTNSDGNYSIILANTLVKHNLVESEYNKRRTACENVVKIMAEKLGKPLQTLRDLTLQELMDNKDLLSEIQFKRAKYVLEENVRVEKMIEAMKVKDWVETKKIMREAHYGLKDEYEVSCPELDYLVELTEEHPEVYGSRMMGGGFGGCTVTMVKNGFEETLEAKLTKEYEAKYNKIPGILRVNINDGVCEF